MAMMAKAMKAKAQAITTTALTDRSTSPKNYYGHVSGSGLDLFRISSSVVVLVDEYRS